MEQAVTADFEGVAFRVVRANHLAVIALSVGRAKDLTRILALLESGSVSREAAEAMSCRDNRQVETTRRGVIALKPGLVPLADYTAFKRLPP